MTTVYHISDWHTNWVGFDSMLNDEIRHQNLGAPDLVIITGDMVKNYCDYRRRVNDTGVYEARRQLEQYQIMVSYIEIAWPGVDIMALRGNHDWTRYGVEGTVGFDEDEGRTVMWNGLKIHGFKGIPTFRGHWNDELSEEGLGALCDLVPADTDILLTHTPPHGILDDTHDSYCTICGNRLNKLGLCGQTHVYDPAHPPVVIQPHNVGSTAVRALVDRLPNLKAHFFGHIHECGGRVEVRGNTVFSNASCSLNKVII